MSGNSILVVDETASMSAIGINGESADAPTGRMDAVKIIPPTIKPAKTFALLWKMFWIFDLICMIAASLSLLFSLFPVIRLSATWMLDVVVMIASPRRFIVTSS